MKHRALTFTIRTPTEFLAKLKAERAAVSADPLSARHALNAAMTAWHLLEWVWGGAVKEDDSVRRSLGVASKDFNIFRAHILDECPEMEAMQCLAEGTKHFGGTEGKLVQEAREHRGAFSSDFGKGFDTSRLEIVKIDGTRTPFDVALDEVLSFWERFFEEYLTQPQEEALNSTDEA